MQLPIVEAKKACARLETLSGTAVPVPAGKLALPMSMDEARDRGWDELDVVFITGDGYIDHPSFAMAILGRTLEAAGFRVGIVSQPDWRNCDDWRRFGRPRLFFGPVVELVCGPTARHCLTATAPAKPSKAYP